MTDKSDIGAILGTLSGSQSSGQSPGNLTGQIGQSSGPGLAADPDYIEWVNKREGEKAIKKTSFLKRIFQV